MKLLLNDGNVIQFQQDLGIFDIVAIHQNMDDAITEQKLITEENVSHIQIQTDGGTVVGEYNDLAVISTEVAPKGQTFEHHIHLRERLEMEDKARAYDILIGEAQ